MPSERALRAAEDFNRFAIRAGAPGRCDPELSFETPELMAAVTAWRDLAAGRPMPLRSDVNARSLRRWLPNVMLVDAHNEDNNQRYAIRLMGTALAQVLGDHTGQYLDEAIVSPYRERWNAAVAACIAANEPLRLCGRLDYGEHHLTMEFLLAPIDERNDRACAVLIVAYAKFSARHVFEPLVKNALAGKVPRKAHTSSSQ